MIFAFFNERRKRRSAAEGLYQAALHASRQAAFFENARVPDTLDGRFDLLCLHIALIFDHLSGKGPDGARMAQAVFDATFRAIDTDLREQGIDLSVVKYVRKMMKAFNGRMQVYQSALATMKDTNSKEVFERAIGRNIYRVPGSMPLPRDVQLISSYALAARQRLADVDVILGQAIFPPAKNIFAESVELTDLIGQGERVHA